MASRSFISGVNVSLYIDASDFFEKIERCRQVLSAAQLEKMLKNTLYDVGQRAPKPIAQEQVKEYAVTQTWVKSQIGFPKMSGNSLMIPLRGAKGSIGGRFHAQGRKKGKVNGQSVKGRIVASIVRGQKSVMPSVMSHQGGNPPFMMGKVAMTRRGPGRFPIVAVKGLAVPQMPLNRAASGTQDRILEIAEERLEHNFERLFKW